MKRKADMQQLDQTERIKFICSICCMLILAAVSMVLYHVMNADTLYHDSSDYWTRGQMLWQNGKFSFLNLSDGFRGYVYPLYLGICSRVGKYGFMVINSLLVSVWFVYLMPKLHFCCENELNVFTGYIKCVVSYVVFMLFFSGLALYPLSDLLAVMLCGFSILLELQIEKSVGLKNTIYSFLFGVVLYFAYNVRTIYLFAGIWLFVKLFLYLIKSSEKLVKRVAILGITILGTMIAALPQVYMNYHMLGKLSLIVPTNGLMLAQVSWGIRYQRYDTYVGENIMHPSPQMYFIDPVGNALMQRMEVGVFESWGDFLKFAFGHPLDLLGIYVRHIVNALFPCWPGQYVMNLDNNKVIYVVVSICIFFLFGLALLNCFINREILKRYTALIIPILFILVGAVEVRFFAAGYFLVIGSLCYNTDWISMKKYILVNRWKVLSALILFGGVLIALWSSMLASESVLGIFL